jgi:competence protein ComEC
MRDAGLAHLLSISGLHIAVVVGLVALLTRAVLALSPWLALRLPVPGQRRTAAAMETAGQWAQQS